MGGFVAVLGKIGGALAEGASTAGSAMAEGASAVGGAIANGASAVGEFGGKAADLVKEGADAFGKNVLSPAVDFAAENGEYAGSKAKDFFSQAWDNAKNDIGERLDKVIVRDESGGIDGWKTAGNIGYEGGKAILSRSFAGGEGGDQAQMPDMSQAKPPPFQQAETNMPDAENELNKLRNRMNSLG